MNFKNMGVNPQIINNLEQNNIIEPTEIQVAAIPLALDKKNIVAKAQTGSGKTLAFLIPIMNSLLDHTKESNERKKALIISPTRDLANQTYENARMYVKGTDLFVGNFCGGSSYDRQIANLKRGVDIIIGTPGRLLDLAKKGYINTSMVEILVLDEADEILNIGFVDEINKIIALLKNRKQTLLFSATINKSISKLINDIVPNHELLDVLSQVNINDCIDQKAYLVHHSRKIQLLIDVLNKNTSEHTIIFTRTKNEAKIVSHNLKKNGFAVDVLHSDKKQNARERTMKSFKNYDVNILVATNIAARGIDVKSLGLVINWNLPDENETYIHRIGRTGRAGKKGLAISFIDRRDLYKLKAIEQKLNNKIEIIDEENYTKRDADFKMDMPEFDDDERSNNRSSRPRRTFKNDGEYKPRRFNNSSSGSYSSGGRSSHYQNKDYDKNKDFGERKSYSSSKDFGDKRSYSPSKDFGDKRSYSSSNSYQNKNSDYSGGGETRRSAKSYSDRNKTNTRSKSDYYGNKGDSSKSYSKNKRFKSFD